MWPAKIVSAFELSTVSDDAVIGCRVGSKACDLQFPIGIGAACSEASRCDCVDEMSRGCDGKASRVGSGEWACCVSDNE